MRGKDGGSIGHWCMVLCFSQPRSSHSYWQLRLLSCPVLHFLLPGKPRILLVLPLPPSRTYELLTLGCSSSSGLLEITDSGRGKAGAVTAATGDGIRPLIFLCFSSMSTTPSSLRPPTRAPSSRTQELTLDSPAWYHLLYGGNKGMKDDRDQHFQ